MIFKSYYSLAQISTAKRNVARLIDVATDLPATTEIKTLEDSLRVAHHALYNEESRLSNNRFLLFVGLMIFVGGAFFGIVLF